MKFRTAYSDSIRFNSPVGDRFRKKYQKASSEDGKYRLEEVGVEDVYDSIQKAAQGITVDDLIRRYKAGDLDAIPPVEDSYVDLTGAPRDMLEAHTMLSAAKLKYNALPASLREKFGNSFEDFLKASADGSVYSMLQVNSNSTSGASPLNDEELVKIRNIIGGNSDA